MSGKRGNNEGSLTKRPDGRWEARISLEGGRRKSFYAKTRQEAARLLAAAMRDQDKGLPIVAEKQTVAQYLVTWLESTKSTIKPRTYIRYEQFARVHLVPALGNTSLARLTPQHIQKLYATLLSAGLSSTTVHHVHAMLHKALESALRLGLVQRNVSELVDPPRIVRKEMHVLTPEQVRTLLDAAKGDRFEALYVLAISTGMRQGELLALKWKDVDLDRATLTVHSSLQKVSGQGFTFSEPKTKRSRRKITLPTTAVDALRAHRGRQLTERLALGSAWDDMDLVFCNTVGRPLESGHVLHRQFHPLLERAGLPRIRFHDLRHTAATLLLSRGINPKVVSELLGHAQIAITLDTYSHVLPDMQQQAADAMDAALAR